jgi:alpha-galactosidase
MWCMMAAPLITGNDLSTMSATTKAILTNREVIAVDQDALGKQGRVVAGAGTIGKCGRRKCRGPTGAP